MKQALCHLHLAVSATVNPSMREVSKNVAETFVKDLLVATDMKPLGPLVWSNAEDLDFPGQSLVQMITTSHCSLHYFSDINELYFDFYSCKEFNPEKVISLLRSYFGLETYHGILYRRGRANKAELSKIGKW